MKSGEIVTHNTPQKLTEEVSLITGEDTNLERAYLYYCN